MTTSRNSIILPPNLLKDLPLEQLKKIAENDDSFSEYFCTLELDEIKQVNDDRDKIVQKNREIGADSLSMKSLFEEKKAKLVQSNMDALELKESYNKLYEKLRSMGKSCDQKSILKDLQDLARDSEREADDLTDQFLDKSNEMEVDSFIKTFVDSRITYWSRKVKAEKMDELIKQGALHVTPMSSMGNPIPYPPYSSSESSMPPYPAGSNSSMPSTHVPPYPLGGPATHSLSTPQVPTQHSSYSGTSPSGQRKSLPTQSLHQGGRPPQHQYATVQQTQPQYSMPPSPYQGGVSYTPQGQTPPRGYSNQSQPYSYNNAQPQRAPYPTAQGGSYSPRGSYPPQGSYPPGGRGYPSPTQSYRQPNPPPPSGRYQQRRY